MTGNTSKFRAVFLAALMVLSVFAGTVAFAGSASANPENYNGGAVHYVNASDDAVIEIPFDGPIAGSSIDDSNFTVLDDGDDISDQINYTESANEHDDSGNVELILEDRQTPINSNDLEVDLSSDVASNPGEKAIAFAAQSVDLGAGGNPSSDITTFQGTTVAFYDSSAQNNSDVDSFEISDADEDAFDYFQSYSTGENSTVFYFDTSDRDLGDYDLNNSGFNLTIRDLGLSVSVDDLNVTTDDDIEGTVDTRSSDRAIEIELIDDAGDGDTVKTIGTTTSGQGDFDFTFPASDLDEGDYTVKVTDNGSAVEVESSVVTVSEADDDAEFSDSTVSDQRGDIVEMTVEMEGTDFATITVGEVDGSEGVVANATVEDEDDDGQVTVFLNTYELGDPTDGSATPFAVDDDSDDSVSSQELTDNVTDLIDAGEYDLEVAAGETAAADLTGGADGVATLVLEERSTETLRMWTGSKGELSPSDLEDVNEALANGEITQSSEIAVGDYAVHQLVASGFEGALDARENEDVTDTFLSLTETGPIDLTIEEADPGANQDAEVLNLTSENTTVIADGANDTYFVIVDTDSVGYVGGGDLPADDDTDLETNFTVLQDDAGFDFTPDDQFEDDENEETFVTFTAAEPDAGINEPFDVAAASGQTVSGTTNIAPGTEIDVRVRSDDGVTPSFLKTASPVVQSDGTWSATFDFSEQNVGDTYEIVVQDALLASDETEDGEVVEAVETATATPEPGTDTPEPDTATPEPDTATPEPDTATPEPDTATEEPATETPTSTPGFGVVVALTALIAAALLAIRRD
ncbi:PGF-CTERM sorting domain-containing protein [Halobellus sp. Atlit-31R]|nr:PGF-CTERM sorting domain-containing protein [Halobellus sp. Atlit-31R]